MLISGLFVASLNLRSTDEFGRELVDRSFPEDPTVGGRRVGPSYHVLAHSVEGRRRRTSFWVLAPIPRNLPLSVARWVILGTHLPVSLRKKLSSGRGSFPHSIDDETDHAPAPSGVESSIPRVMSPGLDLIL